MLPFSEIKFAIVGATGNVGQEFLKILHERNVPYGNIFVIASERSIGKTLQYGDAQLTLHDLDSFDFSQCQVGLFSPGAKVSSVFAPKAAALGCWVVDNTSFFRMDPDVPLVIPEINASTIKQAKRNIIANPNCSTIQMLMALQPIDRVSRLRTVIVSTYQSVSGAGRLAELELRKQIAGDQTVERFPCPIAYNVIPQIDVFLPTGETKEEWKMVMETQKILQHSVDVFATCVRVPVVRGHSEAVTLELTHDVPLVELEVALNDFPGVTLKRNSYVTPLDIEGDDDVYVSRLRKDPYRQRWYQMWVVSDNIRKGAALNAVQIVDKLVEFGMLRKG
ncbi:MAG: aspartate-semialdehyde dehydrogenase [Holosporales bacterium]|jgi:aspartate-semialdehyde dehydrogenase|nr:aspartate-semialdehyde dehydrogenase [Holosporales bacterium]